MKLQRLKLASSMLACLGSPGPTI